MKIAAVCCTFLRPEQLGQMIRCFELQDYAAAECELVVLDDAGQYDDCRGDGWSLRSVAKRFPSLGEKRNAAAQLVSGDCDAIAVWDDDDLYLPWALRACAAALEVAPWSRPSRVLHVQENGTLRQHETGGLFHGGWAYRRDVFDQVGGYPAIDNGEDRGLARRLQQAGVETSDPCELGFRPFYVFRWHSGSPWHLSNLGPDGYRRLGAWQVEKTPLRIADPAEIDLENPTIVPGVHPRMF